MKITLTLLVLIAHTITIYGQTKAQKLKTDPLVIGEQLELKSEILNENRILNIYLPLGYEKEAIQKYPVIYLLDGSMDEDFIHISGLVQFGSFSWINMIPESIVVGIANVDRKRDFTYPTSNEKDKIDFPTTGGSKGFIEFITEELQPFITKEYNTNGTNTLIGQSLGGLLATEILFKNPDTFDNYIIVSPSLWWDDGSLLNDSPKMYDSNKSVYIAVGKEGDIMEKAATDLFDKLNLSKRENTNLYYSFFEKQNHGDALHLAVYDAFEKIFTQKDSIKH